MYVHTAVLPYGYIATPRAYDYSLPEPLKDFIDQQMTARGFGNVSEYFRTLVHEAQEKERQARLEELLLEGLNSGEDIPLDDKFWKDLRAEALEMIEERKKHKQG